MSAETVRLSDRFSDRLEVALYWVKGTIDTYVQIIDYKTEPPINSIIPVPEGVNPNDVFTHPFAYEATRIGAVPDGRGTE